MSSLIKRERKKGHVWEVQYFDQNGKKRSKNKKTHAEAVKFAAAVNVAVSAGTHVADADSITLGVAIDQWLYVCEHVGRKHGPVDPDNSLPSYKQEAKHLKETIVVEATGLKWDLSTFKLSKLTGGKMMAIRDQLIKDRTEHMAQRCLNRLKSALREAQSRDQIMTSPWQNVSIVIASRKKKARLIPQPHHAQRLLGGLQELVTTGNDRDRFAWQRYRMMIWMLLFTGLRPSEVRGLPRKDALPEGRNSIRVSQKASKETKIGDTKTFAGKREIDLWEPVADELRVWLDTRVGSDPEDLVFATRNGTPQSHSNFSKLAWWPLQRHCGLIGADGATMFEMYTMRHFFASALVARGAKGHGLAKAVGHSKVSMTMDIYAHLFVEADTVNQGRITGIAQTLLAPKPASFIPAALAAPTRQAPNDEASYLIGLMQADES